MAELDDAAPPSTPPAPPLTEEAAPPSPPLAAAVLDGEPRAPAPPRRKPGRPRHVAAARRTDKPTLTPRLSVFINDDCEIQFDRTKAETVEQLRRAIAKPEAQKRLGLVDDAGAPTTPRTWQGMTATLIDSINAIAIQAAVNTWKLTDEQAAILFLRNAPAPPPGKPTVYDQTVQLTGELLDKYFPGGFGEYDKEISLMLILGGFTINSVQKIAAMKAAGPRAVVHFPDAGAAGAGES